MAYPIQFEVAAIMHAVMAQADVKGFNHGLILPFPCRDCNKTFARKAINSNMVPLVTAPVQVPVSAVRQKLAVNSGATSAEIPGRVGQVAAVHQSFKHGID
jgi:predicted metal-binding protein